MNTFDYCALSDPGAALQHNDDFVVADPDLGVFIVADGMGGRPGGDTASRLASTTFWERLRRCDRSHRLQEEALREAVIEANLAVRAVAEGNPLLSGLGTTLSAVVLEATRGMLVHVGDSRIYRFRAGRLQQLTSDHTLATELVERNRLSPEAAERYPLRHVLTRAVGSLPSIEPDINEVALCSGDWLLLATDGVVKVVPLDQLARVIESQKTASAEKVGHGLMAAVKEKHPDDNVSMVLIRIRASIH